MWLDFPTTSIPLPHWKSIFLCVCVCVLYVRVCTRVWLKVHSSFPTSKFLYREFSLHRWEESWEGWLKAGVFSLWNSKGLQSFSFHSIEPERSCSRCLASGTQLAGHTSPGFWTLRNIGMEETTEFGHVLSASWPAGTQVPVFQTSGAALATIHSQAGTPPWLILRAPVILQVNSPSVNETELVPAACK